MPGREPHWWYGAGPHWQATLLSPFATIAGAVAAARIAKPPSYRSRLPVVCVGNFTVGGSGKTPLALLIARLVADAGFEPWFLTRGYGGKVTGPLRVDASAHNSDDVGDEPLLLARQGPTIVSRDRVAGAKAIEAAASPRTVIIMDDGLQNPYLAKDLVVAVISGDRGLGNGHVIPAGPLRAPLSKQIGLADLIVVTGQNGSENRSVMQCLSGMTGSPIVAATTRAAQNAEILRGRRVVAFAGIANPQRFFSMLENLGSVIIERRVFADHHAFSDSEARDLIDAARRTSADLITTEKDLARLSGRAGVCAELLAHSTALAIETTFEDSDLAILKGKIGDVLGC